MCQVGFSEKLADPLATRSACIALKHVAAAKQRPSEARLSAAFAALARTAAAAAVREAGWYSAAEAAVNAIYALHPQPSLLCEAILRQLANAALTKTGTEGRSSTDHLGPCNSLRLGLLQRNGHRLF
jgi:condensin complex subunit 1